MTFEQLTSEQKTRVETLEIAECSLGQLIEDIDATLSHERTMRELSKDAFWKLASSIDTLKAERDRMLGEIESIKRGRLMAKAKTKIVMQMPVDAAVRLMNLLNAQTPEGEAARKALGVVEARLHPNPKDIR